ncbi:hypothetical protein [Streptomyces sp. ODS28]|uniref:hypothetical protein n=1 Tax=Streptomyces sp. ODS28 TaxID=3136688 RepID=UPI0031E8B24E
MRSTEALPYGPGPHRIADRGIVMLIVTVDQYSGLPNPSWHVDEETARDVLRKVARNRDVTATEESGHQGLGFRGFELQLTDDVHAAKYGLPDRFRIANGGSGDEEKGTEIAQQLVDSMPAGETSLTGDLELDDTVRRHILDNLSRGTDYDPSATDAPPGAPEPPMPTEEGRRVEPGGEESGTNGRAACQYWATAFNPAFWNNDPNVRVNNNCYNYAVNRRTNTFAQPGRAHGVAISPIQCDKVIAGVLADGARQWGNCFPAGTGGIWLMALVVAPNYDYHWYRYSAEGFWGHKPGQTAARNTDNDGKIVYSPYYASRAPYTNFCGYFQCAYTMTIR